MKVKMEKVYPKIENIIPLLKMGIVVASIFIAPGASAQIARLLVSKEYKDYDGRMLNRNIRRLYRRGLVSIESRSDGKTVITLSETGKSWAAAYDVKNMIISNDGKWNGKWVVVIFDIDEKKKSNRVAFRIKLRELGFFQFQESVYFFPYPCEKEIEFLRNYYNVSRGVTYMVIDKVEDDSFLRSKFGL